MEHIRFLIFMLLLSFISPLLAAQAITAVDPDLTPQSRALLQFLHQQQGKGILFGQQHASTRVLSKTVNADAHSDIASLTGKMPAIYGWDTLSVIQPKPEGEISAAVKAAYHSGGIITLSTHFYNPVTGGDFWDTQPAIAQILPGGSHHQQFKQELDQIAAWADQLIADDGSLIPVIFRILHENTGSWFWWGAAQSSPEQYKALYRFIVDYLRLEKGVHNFLYAYSPAAGFANNKNAFFERYPGDAYVDVLGFDDYQRGDTAQWIQSMVATSRTLVEIAQERGKVAALTEFGQASPNEATSGFYLPLLAALQADPLASQLVYMMTWANFSAAHSYVPLASEPAVRVDDFKAFAQHPYLLLADKLPADLYQRQLTLTPLAEQLVVMAPLAWQPLQGSTLLQLKVQTPQQVKQVWLQAQGKSWQLQQEKWYWQSYFDPSELSFQSLPVTLELIAELANGQRLTAAVPVLKPQAQPDANLLFDPNWSSGFSERLRQLISGTGDGVTFSALCTKPEACLLAANYTLHPDGHTGLRYMPQHVVTLPARQQLSFYLQPDNSTQRLHLELFSAGKSYHYPLDVSQWPTDTATGLREGRQVRLPLSVFCAEQQCFEQGEISQLAIFIHAANPAKPTATLTGELYLGAIQVQAVTDK